MKKRTKIISVLMVAILMMGIFSVASFAAETKSGKCGANLTYTITDTKIVISGKGEMYDYNNCYSYNRSPFADYTRNRYELVVENGVTRIGKNAFGNLDFSSITLPGSVRIISESAFRDSNIKKSIVLPEGLKIIEDYAFDFDKTSYVKLMTIPSTVNYIGKNAFNDKIFEYKVNKDNPNYKNGSNGALYNKDMTILLNCSRSTELFIPKTLVSINPLIYKNIRFESVNVEAGNEVFATDKEKTLLLNKEKTTLLKCTKIGFNMGAIPKTVDTIGDYAFYGLELGSKVSIPGGVKYIGEYAFSGATFSKLVLPDSLISIGDSAFENISEGNLSSVDFGKNIKYIGNCAFYGNYGMNSIVIPESVEYIGSGAFKGTLINKIEVLGKDTMLEDSSVFDWAPKGTTSEEYSNGYNTKVYCYHNSEVQCVAQEKNLDLFYIDEHTYGKSTLKQATMSADGQSEKECKVCGEKSVEKISKVKSVTLSKTSITYDGKVHKPTVTVKDSSGKKLKNGTDYKIKYSNSESKSIGKYTVTITFKGKYSGSKKLTYNIVPAGTTLSKLSAKSKGFTATWKKQSAQTSGYEIEYSTSSKFTENTTKKVIVKDVKTVSKTISGLKANTKYYVRVRTYKTVDKTSCYSEWTKSMTVTTKK